ncbi:hypothetical protein HPB49_017114 [Dermacentor silvarum]|uniref:Uncharacterized protein n=1 Tax=Dermacentor silvarum TaxID=543639 RepID=A0ACB8E1Q8_DERSI|nr:hypothetical protein HPB49_017114 [Dermacentor silvarum]
MDFLEFPHVFKEDCGAMIPGRLKMTSQGVVFKNSKTGKVERVQGSEMESISWQRLGAGYGLRIMMKTGGMCRFGGFQEDEQERLAKFFQHHFELPLASRELCLKGWNWGTARFEGSVLSFDVEKNSAYEIPLSNVSHCTTAKNEVTLEFHQNDDAAVSLMDLRFHISTDPNSEMDAIQAFRHSVLSKASIIQATGDAMVTFKELRCLTPRGRYDIKIFSSCIQLRGNKLDYKFPLTTVLRLFLLPYKDNLQKDEVNSDESSDESYNPSESGSEVAEEFDSNVETSSDSEAGSGRGKGRGSGSRREKAKNEKKEKKSKSAKSGIEPGRKQEKPRRPKKGRDDNKPKRPPNAYMLWLAENRDKIKKDNPSFTIIDVMKRAGELWKEVTNKTKWEEQAAEAAAKYKVDIAAYQASLKDRPQESDDEKDEKKPVKKSKPPKRAPMLHVQPKGFCR